MGRLKDAAPQWKKSNKRRKSIKYKQQITGHGFSERSDKALNDYKKLLLKESKSLTEWSKKLQKIYEEENSDEENEAASEKTSVQKNGAKTRKLSYKEKKKLAQEKRVQEKQEKERQRKERDEALERYRKKKENTYRKLKKTNFRGQPFMGARVKLLLEKLQPTDHPE